MSPEPTDGQDDTSLGVRVEARLAALTTAQRRVAILLAEQPGRAGALTAAELGRLAGVSDATVVRTVQRLGYAGLLQLRRAVNADLTAPTPSDRLRASLQDPGTPSGVLPGLISDRRTELARLLDPHVLAALAQAAKLVAEGSRVRLAATGPSQPVAAYGAVLLGRIGLDAATLPHSGHAAADDLVSLRPGDVLIVLAYTRLAAHTRILFDHADHLGLDQVLLTDILPAPTARTLVLRTGRGAPGSSASHVATLAALEVLALAVAERTPDRATSALDRLDDLRRRIAGRDLPVRR